MASIPIDSVDAIREKATASASLSNTPGEVTEEMQVCINYMIPSDIRQLFLIMPLCLCI